MAAIASTYPSKVNSACCFLIQYILIRSINELEAYYLTDETPLSLLIKLLATKKHSIYIYYYILYNILMSFSFSCLARACLALCGSALGWLVS